MSWRDRVDDARGSFRGAGFWVERASAQQGRRVQVHEYPLRDQPYAEDLGRRTREWTIECYLLGEDYDQERDALIEAIEQPGQGELVHPYYGRHPVVVTDFRVRETTREGGMARVSLSVMVADDAPRLPRATRDTQAQVREAADAVERSALEDFLERFETVDLAADRVAQIQAHVDRTLERLDAVIGDVTGPLADVIRAPANFAGALLGAIGRIGDTVGEPGRALGLYEDLFTAGDEPRAVSVNAPAELRAQTEAVRATNDLVRRGAVTQAAREAADEDWLVADDATAARDTIIQGIDTLVVRERIPDDALYADLSALRAAVVRDLDERGAELPRLTTYTPAGPLPALVIAQRLYGDARRADAICARNRIRHPGRVPGGEPLEVSDE